MDRKFRLAWCNNGRIWLERIGKAGKPLGEPTDITCEFWGVAIRCLEEHGEPLNGHKKVKGLTVKERDKKTGKKRAFEVILVEVPIEETDEV
jgi:hypothetical protein